MEIERPTLSLSDGATLRDFISRIGQGIYIVTPDGEIVDANPALLEIFGAESVEQLRQFRSQDLVVDPGVLDERRRLLAENGWIRNYCYEIRCLNGEHRRVRDTVFTQRNADGEVRVYHGILDVVDEPPADTGETTPLSSFFTGAPAGLAILDNQLRFVRINRRLAQMHVLPVEEHIGRSLHEVVPGLTPIIEPVLQQVLATGVPAVNIEIATEDPHAAPDARVWRLSAFPVGPVRETPTGVGLVVIDITDTKRLEQEARLDGRYLAALIESSPLGMVTLDTANRVVSTNGAFERMFRISREQVVGTDLDEFIATPEDRSFARDLTDRTQHGEQLRLDVTRRRSDGSRITVRLHSTPLVLDGRHIGAHVIYEDIGD